MAHIGQNGQKLENEEGGEVGINGIPLSGTTPGHPVTGGIEMVELAKNLWIAGADGDGGHYIQFTEGAILIKSYRDSDESRTHLIVTPTFIRVESTSPTARGIVSAEDYSEVAQDLDYVQKKYVDEAIENRLLVKGEFTDNTAAVNGGLVAGDVYSLPAQDGNSLLAVVK